MADDTRPAIGGGTGGTAGTGEPDATPDSGVGAKEVRDDGQAGLVGGEDELEGAIGAGGGDSVGGTGSSVANSGRLSSEGTGGASSPTDPGDPGGMGGVRAGSRTPHDRPPGGVSPLSGGEEESRG